MKVIALYGSVRRKSNSELLANKVLQDIAHTKRFLLDYDIKPIDDKRHDPEGFANITHDDDYRELISEILEHNIVVYVTPIYWYGMSGLMKNFIDRFTESLRDEDLQFKERMQKMKHYAVIVGGDSPYEKGKPLVQQFEYIFDFIGAKLNDWIIGDGNKPGEILHDEAALANAKKMNEQLQKLIEKYGS